MNELAVDRGGKLIYCKVDLLKRYFKFIWACIYMSDKKYKRYTLWMLSYY